MGIFSAILDKLRHHGAKATQAAGGQQNSGPGQGAAQSGTPGLVGSPASGQTAMQDVDVDAVLSQLATQKGGGGNYRESIVDMLKLLDLDSSLNARKELAQELNVNAGAHGSAEQNIALHKAVMRKVAENGGKVPESMKN